ncbi:kinase-like domain-containing protein [Geopyxis carbonaria]|nr:kinase-like domain-containing protein [Geopyxis carbonaria]
MIYLLKKLWLWCGRKALPLRILLGRYFYPNGEFNSQVFQIDPWTILKYGAPDEARLEAEAMDFIRHNTSIPVPRLVDNWTDRTTNRGRLLIEFLPGVTLDTAWPQMSSGAQKTTQKELKAIFDELRALPQPEPVGWIGSVNGGGLIDHRLAGDRDPRGPFKNEKEFNDFLLFNVEKHTPPNVASQYRVPLDGYNHRVVFCHADICYKNILVDPETGHVTGVIDWAMAGWWPEYWEYRKARIGWRYQGWWVQLLNEVLEPFVDEWRLDSDLMEF